MSQAGWMWASLGLNVAGLVAVGALVHTKGGWRRAQRLARGLLGLEPTEPAGPSPHWQTRADLYAAHPATRSHVVLVGDSLTEFGPWTELLPGLLVLNRGIAGDTVAGVRQRLAPLVAGPPRAIAVLIGINDLLAGRSPDAVLGDLRHLIGDLRAAAPQTPLLVQSLLPVAPEVVGAHHQPRIDAVNDALPGLATGLGAAWLDLRPALAPADSLSADGLHLSAAGYSRWAAVLGAHLP
ncbi:MAG: GDSL-type esterase/lipase family protein [Candidatus Sericytochromatia bacterium]|nr:GDSL-type esterase/lipase family protein [Candidatus Sericytochromatia bacterium]